MFAQGRARLDHIISYRDFPSSWRAARCIVLLFFFQYYFSVRKNVCRRQIPLDAMMIVVAVVVQGRVHQPPPPPPRWFRARVSSDSSAGGRRPPLGLAAIRPYSYCIAVARYIDPVRREKRLNIKNSLSRVTCSTTRLLCFFVLTREDIPRRRRGPGMTCKMTVQPKLYTNNMRNMPFIQWIVFLCTTIVLFS